MLSGQIAQQMLRRCKPIHCRIYRTNVEAGRDQAHPQGGVAHLVETAFKAWNQGINLVNYSVNCFVIGKEYLAKYNPVMDVPNTANFADPCNVHPAWSVISSTSRGVYSPIYNMCSKLFEMAGVSHPCTPQEINSTVYFPEKSNSDHGGMGASLYNY